MKPKLSNPASRADLIANYAYAAKAPTSTSTSLPTNAPKAAGSSADPAAADQAVTDAIAKLKTALDAAIAAQKADPDQTDPADEKVTAGLDAIAKAVAELEADQASDAAGEPAAPAKPAAKAPAPPPKPAVTAALPAPISTAPAATATAPPTNPVDADGNVDGQAVCANPDCQHLASSHLDDDSAGKNTGACQMTNCACMGMQVDSSPNSGGGDDQPGSEGEGAQPWPDSQELAGDVSVAPAPPGPAKTSTPELNAPPDVAGSENMGPAFTIPVGIIEGQPTGDGRQIATGALTWRTPPLPLMGLATDTHDPMGYDMNSPAVVCGRIDSLERAPGEGSTQIISAKGFYLADENGQYFAGLNEQFGRLGVSGDVAVQESDMTAEGLDDDGWPTDMTTIVTEGVVMGFTIMPGGAAFEGAYIVLGTGEDQAAAVGPIPQQADAVAASLHPVRYGVHFMSYAQCDACEQGLDVLVASGAGPARPPAAWFADPNFTPDDGRLSEILDRRGERAIGGKYACPLTVTDDGRVFGHLAAWGVCHIGKPGCITAPESKSDYAYFKRGQHVITAEGDKVRVGALTVDVGHASEKTGATQAMAHYDNIATVAADVNAGQDEYGIWLAGAIRPTATQQQIEALRASSVSGDWRGLGGSLELVAALAVPVPGFPLAVVAGGEVEVLVASGAGVMHRLKHPVIKAAEEGDVALRQALGPLLTQSRALARERLSGLRG